MARGAFNGLWVMIIKTPTLYIKTWDCFRQSLIRRGKSMVTRKEDSRAMVLAVIGYGALPYQVSLVPH